VVFDLPDFGGLDVVVVRSVDEAMAKAGDAGAIIGYCDAELLAAAPHVSLDLPDFGGLNVVVARSVDEAMAKAGDAGAIIGYCDAELLAAAPHVSWVQIFSAGVERCFPSQKLSNGTVTLTNMQKMSSPVISQKLSNGTVTLTNMQKMSSPVIAEHAIAMMLALTRNLPEFSS
jgi:phosphoglycerate dehydrogenase-like enzyme